MKSNIFLAKVVALSILLSCGNEKRQDSETNVAPMMVIQAAAALYGAYSANRDHNALMGKFKDVQKSIIQSTNIIVDNMERINAQENLAEAVAFLDYFQSYNFNVVNNDLQGRGHSAIRQLERLAINSPHLYRVEAISLLNLVAPAQGVVMLRNGIAPSVIDASIMKIVYNVNDKYLESGVSNMVWDLHSTSQRGGAFALGNVDVYGVFSSIFTGSHEGEVNGRLARFTKWVAPMFEIYRSVEAAQKDVAKLIPGGKVRARSYFKGPSFIDATGTVNYFYGDGRYCHIPSWNHRFLAGLSRDDLTKDFVFMSKKYLSILKSTGTCS